MTSGAPLRVYFVIGEASGDILGSKLVDAFGELGQNILPGGLGGPAMNKRGLISLFDISELSVMGISGVVARLPNLLKRINQTAQDIITKNPDVVLLIDSPEFCYRVAKKVRNAAPAIKIVKFVAPSVWAWRPGRAKKIAPYIDHIFAILPFEPGLMEKLGGPPTTYVGHPLSTDLPQIDFAKKRIPQDPVRLLVMPGSRKSETSLLMPVIRDTMKALHRRSNYEYQITLPAVDKLYGEIQDEVYSWPVHPSVVSGEEAKLDAFRGADLALSASGTATLELAVNGIPTISIYKLDRMMMPLRHLITTWTASLPNLIADYPVVPERINEFAHPEYIARLIEQLSVEGPYRDAQLSGFQSIIAKMRQEEPSQTIAARKIIEIARP